MGCGCKKQSEDAKKYAKIKELATRYGRTTGKTVVIYRVSGGFSFAEVGSEPCEAVEYIYPV